MKPNGSINGDGDKPMDKIDESKINTIPNRIELIKSVLGVAEAANDRGDLKTAIYALRETIRALDSLDDRLVKVQRKHKVAVINESNFHERLNEAKERFKNVIDFMDDAGAPDKFL